MEPPIFSRELHEKRQDNQLNRSSICRLARIKGCIIIVFLASLFHARALSTSYLYISSYFLYIYIKHTIQ